MNTPKPETKPSAEPIDIVGEERMTAIERRRAKLRADIDEDLEVLRATLPMARRFQRAVIGDLAMIVATIAGAPAIGLAIGIGMHKALVAMALFLNGGPIGVIEWFCGAIAGVVGIAFGAILLGTIESRVSRIDKIASAKPVMQAFGASTSKYRDEVLKPARDL